MESFFGSVQGFAMGIFGAIVTIIAWAFAGIIREFMLGCLGGFITFVIIELPVWLGLPVLLSSVLRESVSNIAGRKVVLEVYFISLFILLAMNAVKKVRARMETIMYRR